MKRVILLFGFVLLFASFALAQITIGVNVSATGPAASLGIPNKNATMLGPSEIAGQKIKYVYLDDASDPSVAVQNVKRMISQDNIDVLLGPSITPTSLAIIETVAQAKVPMISYGSATGIVYPVDENRKWVFKTTPNDDVFSNAVFAHMSKMQVKTMSMIAVDDAYGEAWIAATKKSAAEKNIKILTIEKFQRADTSTTAQALRAMQGNPDAILIAGVGTPAATPHRALVERGYKGKIYQSGGAVNADFLRVGGKEVEGGFSPTPPLIVTEQLPNGYPTKAPALEFLKAYESKYGPGSRSQYAGHAADALKMLELCIPQALKKGKPGTLEFREALRTALETAKNVKGVQATYNMSATDHSGVDQRGMVLVKIVNGTWKLEDYPKF
jgi:branched-chain amino acid transport system substrate-binding protein